MKIILLIILLGFSIMKIAFAQNNITPEEYANLSLTEMKKELKKLKTVQVYCKIGPNEIPLKVLKEGMKELPAFRKIKPSEVVEIKKDIKIMLRNARAVSALEAAYIERIIRSPNDKTHFGYRAVYSSEENPYIDYYSSDLKIIHRENIDYE